MSLPNYENNSPWLEQIKRTRPLTPLTKHLTTDVIIVGAGIAGVATAYFTLRDTDKKVIVLEADKVAHGATGHNAGQVVAYFERSFSSIIKEFGKDMALQGLRDVESGWKLIDQIYAETAIDAPLSQFTGYGGCTNTRQVLKHLQNNAYRIEGGLAVGPVFIDEEVLKKGVIPEEYKGMYTPAKKQEILDLLETDDPKYIAALGSKKGCLNSALFTEQLFSYLLKKYPRRLQLFEHSPVRSVRLHKDRVDAFCPPHTVSAEKIVLCTNGFEKFKIENHGGPNINAEFHHMIEGSIGYMAAYRTGSGHPPTAISYFPVEESDDESIKTADAAPYFYLTRRLHYMGTTEEPDLICIGGPEKVVTDTTVYSKHHNYPIDAHKNIHGFLKQSFRGAPKDEGSYAFLWHGLMGYTPNGIRRVGPEPHNPLLLYNLGCNGIGILPSIFAGERIAKILRGDALAPSIWDVPKDH